MELREVQRDGRSVGYGQFTGEERGKSMCMGGERTALKCQVKV